MQRQGEFYPKNMMIRIFFVLIVLPFVFVQAQLRDISSLSVVEHVQLSTRLDNPLFLFFSSRTYPDIVYYQPDSSLLVILKNNGRGHFSRGRIIAHLSNVSSVTVGNINNDGIDDIVVVHRELNMVEILLSSQFDSMYTSNQYPVNFYPEHAVIGDITGDKIPDVISYGKLSSGISVLQGKRDGKLLPFKILFESVPVSECSLIALNGDNIPDVAIHNWLTNETTLHLGLGKFKFSEQTVLSFAQDTVQTLFSDFNNDRIEDIAVLSLQNKSIQILDGDGLGNFSFSQVIPLSSQSYGIRVGSFVTPRSKDIIIYDRAQSSFSLILNRSDGTFYDEIIFGNDAGASILSGDIDGDGFTDVLIVDSVPSQYSIVWNSHSRRAVQGSEQSYAVGSLPTNLSVTDLNNDGKDDIIVSNGASSTLSLLISKGDSFSGQISIEIPDAPVAAAFYSKTDSSITLYSSHHESPKISIVSLRKEKDLNNSLTGDIEQFSISLPEKPVNVLPDVSFMQKGISLYAFMSSATNTILFYQQVKGTRFLTKSLVPIIPSKIIYSTINDLDNDGRTDLLYVYSESSSKRNILGITLNDSTNDFKGNVYSFPLPDSSIRKALLFVDDFNGDQLKDCLLYTAPGNTIRLALGNGESLFSSFETIFSKIRIEVPEQIQVYDFDNDGIQDILIVDTETSVLSLYRGRGNGSFQQKQILISLPKDAIYRCGDFNGDSITDMVYSQPRGYSVTVVYGAK